MRFVSLFRNNRILSDSLRHHFTMPKYRIPSHVKVVSFDAMNTLVKPRERPGKVYARFAASHGLSVDEQLLQAAFGKWWRVLNASHPCFAHRRGGPRHWWGMLIVACIQDATDQPLSPLVAASLSRDLYDYYEQTDAWLFVDDELPSLLSSLVASGRRLAVCSNWDHRLPALLDRLGIAELIEQVVISGDEGVEKPSPRIFQTLAQRMSVPPSAILHIGDCPVRDMEGARSAGCAALLLDDKGAAPKGAEPVITCWTHLEWN